MGDGYYPDERYAARMEYNWDWGWQMGDWDYWDWYTGDYHWNYYWNQNSDFTTNGNTGQWNFNFSVSEAMHQGNDWEMYIRVTDSNNNFSEYYTVDDNTVDPMSVAWYGYMREDAYQVNFNEVAPVDTNNVYNDYVWRGNWEGQPMTNGSSEFTYSSSTFADQNNNTISLDSGVPGAAAGVGKVGLDCTSYFPAWWDYPDFADGNWTRISGTPKVVHGNWHADGLWEDGLQYDTHTDEFTSYNWYAQDDYNNYWRNWAWGYFGYTWAGDFRGCVLNYGGGAPAAGVQYDSTFTVGIGEQP